MYRSAPFTLHGPGFRPPNPVPESRSTLTLLCDRGVLGSPIESWYQNISSYSRIRGFFSNYQSEFDRWYVLVIFYACAIAPPPNMSARRAGDARHLSLSLKSQIASVTRHTNSQR